MSCIVIYYQDGAKMTRPVYTPQEYLGLRNTARQVDLVAKARAGDDEAKRKLIQFNYSCIPSPPNPRGGESTLNTTSGYPLKGCKVASCSVGMDVDILRGENETEEEYQARLAEIPAKVLAKKEEIGLLMLERSAKKGYHLVFKRREGLSQEENLKWASELLGVQYDEGAKDITRVFFTTTASEEDLLFLSDELFSLSPWPLPYREGGNIDTNASCVQNETNAENMEDTGSVVSEESPSLSERGWGEAFDYDQLVPSIIKAKCPNYPIVTQGMRNNTLYETCDWLRYVCEMDPAKMKAVLYPKYTFGLPEAEVDSTIKSAVGRDRGLMPRALKSLVSKHLAKQSGEIGDDDDEEGTVDVLQGDPYSIYPSLASCVVQDMAMPSLPRWVETLLKVVQPGYRMITLFGASTAMMTLLSDVSKKYGSKAESRLNGWSHWDGLSGSGKRQLKFVIEQLIKPIRQEDERKRERVNAIILFNQTAKDGEKQTVPPLAQRILECDTTRKAHIIQMDDLKGKKTYTYAEELSSLNLNRSGYYFRGDFCRLNFDNGMVGCLNATGESQSIVTQCNWDVTTTSTHDQTLSQWQKEVQNGAAQRVLFCLVPDNTWQPKPKEVQWTEDEIAYLDRATAVMMKMQGLVLTPRLDKAMDDWCEHVRLTLMSAPKANRQVERARFRFRSVEIAHTLGVVLHCCHIVQQILDKEDALTVALNTQLSTLNALKQDLSATCEEIAEAERKAIEAKTAFDQWKTTALDLSLYSERKQMLEMAEITADYCLDMQDTLWSKRMRAQLVSNSEGITTTSSRTKSYDDYELMPERFTIEELSKVLTWKSTAAIRKMVTRFIKSNLVRRVATEGNIAVYEKTIA